MHKVSHLHNIIMFLVQRHFITQYYLHYCKMDPLCPFSSNLKLHNNIISLNTFYSVSNGRCSTLVRFFIFMRVQQVLASVSCE